MPDGKGQNPGIPIKLRGALFLAFFLSAGTAGDIFQKPRALAAQVSFDLGKACCKREISNDPWKALAIVWLPLPQAPESPLTAS